MTNGWRWRSCGWASQAETVPQSSFNKQPRVTSWRSFTAVTEPLSVAALTAAVSVFVCRSDRISGFDAEAWAQTASRAHPYPSPPHHGDPQLDLHALVSLETDSSGEEGIEETIVYLWALSNTEKLRFENWGEMTLSPRATRNFMHYWVLFFVHFLSVFFCFIYLYSETFPLSL